MTRTLHLGAEGEEAARHLADVYDLSSTFEPCLILSPHPRALDELRRRLAEHVARIELWQPGEDLDERVRGLTESAADAEGQPVIWLQQRRFDPEPWRLALAALQGRRDVYRSEAPWMWVLAGPPELSRLVHDHAMHVLTGMAVRRNLEQSPRRLVAAPAEPLRWLHLSDFHFQALQRWQRRATLQALLEHAGKLKEDGLAPGFVFVTGDLAWSGKKKEYEQAERFLSELAKVLELEPRRDFYLVPGNHDVDRDAIGPADASILGGLGDQQAIERVLGDAPTLRLLSRRLEAFYAFTERFLGTARGWRGDRPWRVDVREVGDLSLAILQLNSAWASGPSDEQGLLVGEAQVREALEEAAGAFLRIALIHHPLADLRDLDRERLETLLGARGGVHFLLRGHLHRSRAQVGRSPDGVVVELAAGAAHVDGDHPKTHHLTEVDLAAGEAKVRFYRYSPEGRGFWAPDTLAYEEARDGVWTFELPAHLKLDAAAPVAAAPLGDARRATLTARYRAAAAAVHGTVRFVGFADSRPRTNVQVPELFVPLRLTVEGSGKAATWTTSELLQQLAGGAAGGSAARVVVLGDPGSGKTTLCRFAAVVIAGEHDVEGVEIRDELLPLFLPFREYVRTCRDNGDRSLSAFLTEQARNHLQVPVSEAFLEQVLEEGRAVLLLDGLDEVGSAGEREEMRGRVQAFFRAYPKVAALVTSRVAGYDEAPLPWQEQEPETLASGLHGAAQLAAVARAGFITHVRLAAFDDDDLRSFVSHWYAVQEAEDALARDRGVADLLAALDAGPAVRELARNPMLATLIALVHRFAAHLPGERAALYDLCIKTFLETWPASRRRRFGEIDERLQRSYLEELAWRMQTSHKGEVVIERRALIDALVEIVQQRQGREAVAEATQGLIERWVGFLEEGTGLLVEQQRGVFAFFHLSLMEYLAACGMERSGDLVDRITERVGEPIWRQVCLLAIGHRATDKPFLDRLFRRLAEEKAGAGRWAFLLEALHEEAAFDDEQRAAIVRGAADRLLDLWPRHWPEEQRTFDEILRLSRRHAFWARSWVTRELSTAEGERLQAIVALRALRDEETLDILRQRDDAATAAASLLDFWPRAPIGDWAVSAMDPALALRWACGAKGEELMALRSLLVLKEEAPARLRPALVVGLTRSAERWSTRARDWIMDLAKRKRPGGRGLPPAIGVEPGGSIVVVTPTKPLSSRILRCRESEETSGPSFARRFARRISIAAVTGFGVDFVIDYSPDNFSSLAMMYPGHYRQSYPRKLDSGTLTNIAELLHPAFLTGAAEDFTSFFTREYRGDFAIDFTHGTGPAKRFPPPVDETEVRGRQPLRSAMTVTERSEIEVRVVTPAARLVGETWAAAVSSVDRPRTERAAWVHRRLYNVWLLYVWPAVDKHLSADPPPDAVALCLALGWTQATTTWQWPATERWIALLGGPPPDHWLPRSQWHLCWLLHDPDDEGHRQGLRRALEEGLEDGERPGIASALRELLGVPER